jgi:hypothetical protein
MSVNDNRTLVDDTLSADIVSPPQSIPAGASDLHAYLRLSNDTGITVSGTIEHSIDGILWSTLHTLSSRSSNGADVDAITGPAFGQVRANLTVTGGPQTGDVICRVYFDPGNR